MIVSRTFHQRPELFSTPRLMRSEASASEEFVFEGGVAMPSRLHTESPSSNLPLERSGRKGHAIKKLPICLASRLFD